MNKQTPHAGAWFVLGAAFLWGTTGTAQAFAPAGLQTIQVGTAVTLSLAEPMTAAMLGVVVLGEQLNMQAFLGISFIFSGLVVLVARRPAVKAAMEGAA